MKRIILLGILLICCSIVSFSQKDSVYYFYKGEKVFLKQRFDIIHLHLLSDQDSIFRIMNKNHLQLCDFSSENDLFLKNDSEQPISRSVYNELKDIDFVDDIDV